MANAVASAFLILTMSAGTVQQVPMDSMAGCKKAIDRIAIWDPGAKGHIDNALCVGGNGELYSYRDALLLLGKRRLKSIQENALPITTKN